MQRIFLSCVSSQFADARPKLKQQFAEQGLDLRIQEDFAQAGSAYGTLLKIFRFIKEADMVVHLIGAQQPRRVPALVCAELLAALPEFRDWLQNRALLLVFQAGELGYTDFEAYACLYLKKELLLVRYASGAQSAHEARLRQFAGRHVEAKIENVAELLPMTLDKLAEIHSIDRKTEQAAGRSNKTLGHWAFAALVAFAVVASFVFQLMAVGIAGSANSITVFLPQLAHCLAALALTVLLQLAVLTDRLTLKFRVRAAVRNGAVALLIFSLLGWLCIALSGVGAWIATTWFRLICTSAAISFASLWFQFRGKAHSRMFLFASFTLNTLFCAGVFMLMSWSNMFAIWLHWLVVSGGILIVVIATKKDSDDFVKILDYGTSDLTPGTITRSDGFFWHERQTVMDALRVEDFGHDYPKY